MNAVSWGRRWPGGAVMSWKVTWKTQLESQETKGHHRTTRISSQGERGLTMWGLKENQRCNLSSVFKAAWMPWEVCHRASQVTRTYVSFPVTASVNTRTLPNISSKVSAVGNSGKPPCVSLLKPVAKAFPLRATATKLWKCKVLKVFPHPLLHTCKRRRKKSLRLLLETQLFLWRT